ncbi:hypothetical protein [Segeticoccus rhizosphaerae]|jgi:uncharacterized protein HemY|uniref:hypothetical protein n=1 Tax=Segeticoccus rhizosphaerae TaxID=1104777 RepID=UPI00138FE409|nr:MULTISPECIES: hypothetical protein [Intrasporangiaceae]
MHTSDWIFLVVAVVALAGAMLLIRVISRTMIEAHFERKAREREAQQARRQALRDRLRGDQEGR